MWKKSQKLFQATLTTAWGIRGHGDANFDDVDESLGIASSPGLTARQGRKMAGQQKLTTNFMQQNRATLV